MNGPQRATDSPSQKLSLPLDDAFVTAGYKNDAPAYTELYDRLHNGVDFIGGGTTILAMGDGEIMDYDTSNSGLGNMLVVKYYDVEERSGVIRNSLVVKYCHLASAQKTSGTVSRGEAIATMGATGNADGVHLHLEVSTSANYYGRSSISVIDPFRVLYLDAGQSIQSDGEPYDTAGRAWYSISKINSVLSI